MDRQVLVGVVGVAVALAAAALLLPALARMDVEHAARGRQNPAAAGPAAQSAASSTSAQPHVSTQPPSAGASTSGTGGSSQSSVPQERSSPAQGRGAGTPAIVRTSAGPVRVSATAQTDPVPHRDDAADDPAIWIHPTDPSQSTILGTDKKGGLAVYDLSGRQLQYLADGNLNNVDLRDGFPLGGGRVALVTATNQSTNTLAVYRVDPATRQLVNVAARSLPLLKDAYGTCMYRSPTTEAFYAIVLSEQGMLEQWALFDAGTGRVDGQRVRTLRVGGKSEGCVADDSAGHLYVAEEDVGIWKYGAEPEAGTARTQVDTTGAGGHLTADVEGLALYDAGDGTGYLLASSQGSDSFVVYRREGGNEYVLTFEIVAGNGIDGVTETDGIDVTSASLGPAFPEGLFVAQDDATPGRNQNFKLVPWGAIAREAGLPLATVASQGPP